PSTSSPLCVARSLPPPALASPALAPFPLPFLSVPPPPPRSTLLPYTTLFRSHHDKILAKFLPKLKKHFDKHGVDAILYSLKWFLDRKSTRLNSSHVSTSYAVFCLKKKSTANTTDVGAGEADAHAPAAAARATR